MRFCSSASLACTSACCDANSERCASSWSSELATPLVNSRLDSLKRAASASACACCAASWSTSVARRLAHAQVVARAAGVEDGQRHLRDEAPRLVLEQVAQRTAGRAVAAGQRDRREE